MYVRFCEHMQSAQYRHDLEQEIALETVPIHFSFTDLLQSCLYCASFDPWLDITGT